VTSAFATPVPVSVTAPVGREGALTVGVAGGATTWTASAALLSLVAPFSVSAAVRVCVPTASVERTSDQVPPLAVVVPTSVAPS
jgi:hypothetical protein